MQLPRWVYSQVMTEDKAPQQDRRVPPVQCSQAHAAIFCMRLHEGLEMAPAALGGAL